MAGGLAVAGGAGPIRGGTVSRRVRRPGTDSASRDKWEYQRVPKFVSPILMANVLAGVAYPFLVHHHRNPWEAGACGAVLVGGAIWVGACLAPVDARQDVLIVRTRFRVSRIGWWQVDRFETDWRRLRIHLADGRVVTIRGRFGADGTGIESLRQLHDRMKHHGQL
jgi:hypothetical protein